MTGETETGLDTDDKLSSGAQNSKSEVGKFPNKVRNRFKKVFQSKLRHL